MVLVTIRVCPTGQASERDARTAPSIGQALALRAHCVGIVCAEAGILTKVIRLVVTVLFPRNPFQKNEQSENI